MERKTKKEPETKWNQREVKIGISNNPKIRLNGSGQVDDSLPGKVVLIKTWNCSDARKLEKELHKYFEDYRFTPRRIGKGGGKTEWFRLKSSQIRVAKSIVKEFQYGSNDDNLESISMTMFYSLLIFFVLFLISNL